MNSDNDNITGYTVVMFLPCNTHSNTTDATIGAGHIYPSDAHGYTSDIVWGLCCSIFSFLSNVL